MKNNQKGISTTEIILMILILIFLVINIVMVLKFVIPEIKIGEENNLEHNNLGLSGNFSIVDENIVEEDSEITQAREEGELLKKNTTLKDINEQEITIPKGFKIAQDSAGTVDNGIVIEDENENQFVWVPVQDINEMVKLQSGSDTDYEGRLYIFAENNKLEEPSGGYGIGTSGYREPDVITNNTESDTSSGLNYDAEITNLNKAGFNSDLNDDDVVDAKDFKIQLQDEFNSMVKSVKKYKGFYIGRFETGNLSKQVAVVKRDNSDIANQDWYTMYKLCKTINSGDSVVTHMIWGCEWDSVLRWFSKSSNESISKKISQSDERGNYDYYYVIPTGSKEEYKFNNIYDMAGNVYDRTMECSKYNNRVNRGGSHKNNGQYHPISVRGVFETTAKSPDYGTRAAMYISVDEE